MAAYEKNNWLNFSFYYNQNKWSFFLKKHLTKIIKSIVEIDENAEYVICLSKYCGENIQLNVLTNNNTRTMIVGLISKKTNIFFKKFPSARKRAVYPLKSFFKDFPVNSIQYNLRNSGLSSNISLPLGFNTNLHKVLNRVIVSYVAKEEVSEEAVFLTNYQLNVAVVKVLLAKYAENAGTVLEQISQKIKSSDETREKWVNQLLIENGAMLTAIIQSILQTDSRARRNKYLWMNEWVHLCNIFFNNSEAAEDVNVVFDKWERLITVINQQLNFGFEGIQLFLIEFIIHNSLTLLNQETC